MSTLELGIETFILNVVYTCSLTGTLPECIPDNDANFLSLTVLETQFNGHISGGTKSIEVRYAAQPHMPYTKGLSMLLKSACWII